MNAIKQIRATLGLTQEVFSDRIGVTQAAVSSYENGRSLPAPEMGKVIIKLARSMGLMIGFDHIYGDEPLPELVPPPGPPKDPPAPPAAVSEGAEQAAAASGA